MDLYGAACALEALSRKLRQFYKSSLVAALSVVLCHHAELARTRDRASKQRLHIAVPLFGMSRLNFFVPGPCRYARHYSNEALKMG